MKKKKTEKFALLIRRISANKDQTRFRVQWKHPKTGKARANILRSLEEAKKLRYKTDLEKNKNLEDIPVNETEASSNKSNSSKSNDNDNETVLRCLGIIENIHNKSELDHADHKTIEKCFDIINKINNIK